MWHGVETRCYKCNLQAHENANANASTHIHSPDYATLHTFHGVCSCALAHMTTLYIMLRPRAHVWQSSSVGVGGQFRQLARNDLRNTTLSTMPIRSSSRRRRLLRRRRRILTMFNFVSRAHDTGTWYRHTYIVADRAHAQARIQTKLPQSFTQKSTQHSGAAHIHGQDTAQGSDYMLCVAMLSLSLSAIREFLHNRE